MTHKHHIGHGHSHDHAHGHQGFFAEQLSTVAITAAYAGIMLLLFYASWSARRDAGTVDADRTVLSIIAPWIQFMVFLGGVVLLVLVIFRAVAVWHASKQPGHDHHHHGPDHGHDHAHDHDHGWSPMKFIPLVLPLVMFFLGLPNDRMIRAVEADIMNRGKPTGNIAMAADPIELSGSFGIASLGDFGMNGIGGWEYAISTALSYVEEEVALPVDARADLDMLEKAAQSPGQREHWRSLRRVEVEGMFSRLVVGEERQTLFRLVRLRIACCISDARPASMPAFSRKNLDQFADGQWIVVQGRVDFQPVGGKLQPVMRVFQVKKAKMPANPYLS